MIRTLRITSAVAVLLAVVVLGSVLGFLGPSSVLYLNSGARDDKQIGKILEGASAVERFKAQNGNKTANNGETKPPLEKQADLFAEILNPRVPEQGAAKITGPLPTPPKLQPKATPIGPVSGKFELLATSYSVDPKASFAFVQLTDKSLQWVGVGTEINHVTIKEIRRGSVVYWDGTKDVVMNAESTPETSCLLETGKTPATPAAAAPAGKPPVKPAGSTNPASPVKPAGSAGHAAGLAATLQSAQISKEEQESLSQLGSRLQAGATSDPNTADNLIAAYKAGNPSQSVTPPNPGDTNAAKSNWKENAKEKRAESLRQWQKRLTPPGSLKK